MGRGDRSLHRRRALHDHDGAPQTGGPADHRDRSGQGLSHPVRVPVLKLRLTIRVRLTVLYAAAFFLAGAVLLALMYVYLSQVLSHQLTASESRGVHDALNAEFQRARDDTLNTMLVASIVALGVVGIVAAGFGWLLAGRALEPLHQITAPRHRVTDRSLHQRIAMDGPDDEIKDLADTFDAMLERLDRAFDS